MQSDDHLPGEPAGPERQESTAYYAGYRAFAPGVPRPECPYQEIGEQLDWERGWGNAHGYHETHGEAPP
jgi:ribosome modulation factor